MSSTERAPEPTMEEILASIRRIISDDESNTAKARTPAASQQDDEGLEAVEVEADDKIINDIARVLSESGSAAEEEDILDLTAELGGLELVEEPMAADVVDMVDMVEVAEAAPAEAAPQEMIQPAPAPIQAAAAPKSSPQPEVSAPAASMSASEEAASALERAIAALRAGHVPTSISEFMPKTETETEPAPLGFASEPEPQPEPEPQAELEPQTELEAAPEPELVLIDIEETVIIEEPVGNEAEASEPEESSSWSDPEESSSWSDPAPWARAPEPLVEPERPVARTNGGAHGHKTLEDSVKDMLRPMLRQWLDENMPRMVSAALKDELGNRSLHGQGD